MYLRLVSGHRRHRKRSAQGLGLDSHRAAVKMTYVDRSSSLSRRTTGPERVPREPRSRDSPNRANSTPVRRARLRSDSTQAKVNTHVHTLNWSSTDTLDSAAVVSEDKRAVTLRALAARQNLQLLSVLVCKMRERKDWRAGIGG